MTPVQAEFALSLDFGSLAFFVPLHRTSVLDFLISRSEFAIRRLTSCWTSSGLRSTGRSSIVPQCRTAVLGAEVYASENQELILYHTCKSPTCPVAVTGAMYSGCENGGRHCPTLFTRESRSRCRRSFGPFSAIIHNWPRHYQLWLR